MKKNVVLVLGICISIGIRGQNHSDYLTVDLTKHYNSSDLPGFSVAIVSENEILYTRSFGLANKENEIAFESTTIQNLGSVSKTFVGLALIKAIEDGALEINTNINDILPFQVINPYFGDSPILG